MESGVYLPTPILPCLSRYGQIYLTLEDRGLTCTVGVVRVEVQGKFMGDLRARKKMRFFPHDHFCAKKKGIMVCTKQHTGGI